MQHTTRRYGAPSGNTNQGILTGIPQDDVIAEVLQGPPGEDQQPGVAYDLETILPVLKMAYADLMGARPGYRRAEQYASGLSSELFQNARLRSMLGLTDAYAIPYGTVIINAVANRMNIVGLSVDGDDAATKVVEKLWKKNKLPLEEGTLTKDCLRFGDMYLMVWPDDDGNVRIVPNGPMTTRIFLLD